MSASVQTKTECLEPELDTIKMAPITPDLSMKRSASSLSDDNGLDQASPSKRARLSSYTPPQSTVAPSIADFVPADRDVEPQEAVAVPRMFDDDPHHLLRRSVALALEHVGFAAAQLSALDALCSEVDAYAEHFLSKIVLSMNSARRPLPTPLDFKYALAEFDLPLRHIEPHLCTPVPAYKTQIKLEDLPSEDLPTIANTALLGEELNGASDKKARSYIPKRLPSFPSKHTYKWTEKSSMRESDPRRIREEAAKAARQGEEALRRLTKVGAVGKEKDVKKAAGRDPKLKERHKMWEEAMADLAGNKEFAGTIMVIGKEEENRGTIVNSERAFFRKGPPVRRRPQPAAET